MEPNPQPSQIIDPLPTLTSEPENPTENYVAVNPPMLDKPANNEEQATQNSNLYDIDVVIDEYMEKLLANLNNTIAKET